jgi:hypothetical protein
MGRSENTSVWTTNIIPKNRLSRNQSVGRTVTEIPLVYYIEISWLDPNFHSSRQTQFDVQHIGSNPGAVPAPLDPCKLRRRLLIIPMPKRSQVIHVAMSENRPPRVYPPLHHIAIVFCLKHLKAIHGSNGPMNP